MNHPILWAAVAAVGTWAVTALGAATVLLFRKTNAKAMSISLGFAAGVMIAASFWSLLEPAISLSPSVLSVPAWAVVTLGFLGGAVFMWASDKAVRSARNRVRGSYISRTEQYNRIVLLMLSITLHNIPEGLAVGVAFGALDSQSSGEAVAGAVAVAVGIGLQNFPEGAAVALPMRREGISAGRSFWLGQASGLVEPVAGVIGAVAAVCVRSFLPWALSFAAGAMVLVAVHELIPECRRGNEDSPYFGTMGIIAGFAVMMLSDVALG